MANRKTKNSSRISIEVPNPIGMKRSQFIAEVNRLARKEAAVSWDLANPGYSKPKGGRQSKYEVVRNACDYLQKSSSRKLTKASFVKKVADLLSPGELEVKTIDKHVVRWMNELPIHDLFDLLADASSFKKRFNANYESVMEALRAVSRFQLWDPESAYVSETVLWPWMQKHGYRTAGEACELEANGPPELLKEMERAKKEFVYIFESAITPWMEKNGYKPSEYLGLKKKGLPPALSKNIELAKKRFRSLK